MQTNDTMHEACGRGTRFNTNRAIDPKHILYKGDNRNGGCWNKINGKETQRDVSARKIQNWIRK